MYIHDLFSGMTNPPYILDHLEEMAKILNHSRVYSFLHVPVQSGKLTNFFPVEPESGNPDLSILLNPIRILPLQGVAESGSNPDPDPDQGFMTKYIFFYQKLSYTVVFSNPFKGQLGYRGSL